MVDFGDLCYLDVQKTGSNFITEFLIDNIKSDVVSFKKHGRLDNHRSGCNYLISVRNPFSWYLSLYRFGCDGRGGFRARLSNAPVGRSYIDSLYTGTAESFNDWIRFIMDRKNANYLMEGYNDSFAKYFGFMTFRILALSFSRPLSVLNKVKSEEELVSIFDRKKLYSSYFIIKNETLRDDLNRIFVDGSLSHLIKDKATAMQYLTCAPDANVSLTDLSINDLSEENLSLIREREWFVFHSFYSEGF